MEIKFKQNQDQYLEINIELKRNVKKSQQLEIKTKDLIIHQLLHDNSEYRYLYEHLPRARLIPRLVFWPYEDPSYFRVGTKQKWVRK